MCTIALWSDNKVATVSARNMDWLEDMQSDLWVFPRGMERVGLDVPGENSLNWTSKYGSVVASVYNNCHSRWYKRKRSCYAYAMASRIKLRRTRPSNSQYGD